MIVTFQSAGFMLITVKHDFVLMFGLVRLCLFCVAALPVRMASFFLHLAEKIVIICHHYFAF